MTNKEIVEGVFNSQGLKIEEIERTIPSIMFSDALNKFPDCSDKITVEVSINNGDAFVSLRASDFLSLVKETRRINKIFCPKCKSNQVFKNGKNYKGDYQYRCKNDNCTLYAFTVHSD